MAEERRYRLYHIGQNMLLRLLRSLRIQKDSPTYYWSMPVGVEPPLPKGAIVKYVFAEPERGSIGVVVYHESFDVIEEGVSLPEGESLAIGYQSVKIVLV